MTNTDLILIYKKFEEIDRQLKELRQEMSEITLWKNTPIKPVWLMGDGGINKPAQWPNEPYTDYLKRIGEYNEAMIYEDESK